MLFIENPECYRGSYEFGVMRKETFAEFSEATQEAYTHVAANADYSISDELRRGIEHASLAFLLDSVVNVQELNTK